jgi:hypothetical protein
MRPAHLRPEDTTFSFMLSTLSGRDNLQAEAYGRSPVCTLCHERSGTAAWLCTRCGTLCDVCVRVASEHTVDHTAVEQIYRRGPMHAAPDSYCDACGMKPLTLPYYHCVGGCDNYDLCATCETINDTLIAGGQRRPLHDPTHVMVKYRQ